MKLFFLTLQIVTIFFVFSVIYNIDSKAAVFVVNSTNDTADASTNGNCDTGNLNSSGNIECTFRAAITEVLANSEGDTINFAIPETETGFINPDGSRTSTSEPAGTYPTTASGYFFINNAFGSYFISSDSHGLIINGYSQPGASRNTSIFGQPLNTILKIQVAYAPRIISSSNIRISGLNIWNINFFPGGHFTDSNLGPSTENVWIDGNYIGTDINGESANTTSQSGRLSLRGATINLILGTNGDGTADRGERNLISGMGSQYNVGHFNELGSGNIIAGNYIGTDYTGNNCSRPSSGNDRTAIQTAWPNTRIGTNNDGISDSEESNILGCIASSQRAIIRVCAAGDISGHVIAGNYFGISPDGSDLKPIPVDALKFCSPSSSEFLIEENVFTASIDGITLISTLANTVIRENSFFDITGTAIVSTGTNTVIERNTIYNSEGGIEVIGGITTISQNSIYDLGTSLGIDINADGVTANDPGDIDNGTNNFMNFPIINKVYSIGDDNYLLDLTLDFDISEAPFTIELFQNTNTHSSGYGAGRTFIGSTTTSEIGSQFLMIENLSDTVLSDATNISTTATNNAGSTSEFSQTAIDSVITNLFILEGNINEGEAISNSLTVKLKLSALNSLFTVTEMRISNYEDFHDAVWQDYQEELDWTLLDDKEDFKTVYVQFRDQNGNISEVLGLTIQVNIATIEPTIGQPTLVETGASPLLYFIFGLGVILISFSTHLVTTKEA